MRRLMPAPNSVEADPNWGSARAALPLEAGRVIDSDRLLGDGRTVWIKHREELYRLQLTRQGKLILTK